MRYMIDLEVILNQIRSGIDVYTYVHDCNEAIYTRLPRDCYRVNYNLLKTRNYCSSFYASYFFVFVLSFEGLWQ